MRNRWIALVILAVTLSGCGTVPIPFERLIDLIPQRDPSSRRIVLQGYVCRPFEKIGDTSGIELGLRFIVAPVGQSCDLGAREVYVAAVLRSEVEKVHRLVVGQSVTIRGELATRALTAERLIALSEGDARPLNEAIAAESIRLNR